MKELEMVLATMEETNRKVRRAKRLSDFALGFSIFTLLFRIALHILLALG